MYIYIYIYIYVSIYNIYIYIYGRLAELIGDDFVSDVSSHQNLKKGTVLTRLRYFKRTYE